MIKNFKNFLLLTILLIGAASAFGQSVEPSSINVRIEEAKGDGCGDITDCASQVICFDVYFSIDREGWFLQSYNIWMDFGIDDNILSYRSDQSCMHADGGDLDLNQMGKYRFLAGQYAMPLNANEEEIIHNFCVDITDFDGLSELLITGGADEFDVVSSINLVDQTTTNRAINKMVPVSGFTLNAVELTCLDIVPSVAYNCEQERIYLYANAEDATGSDVLDCEEFEYFWEGPNGFTSNEENPIVDIIDVSSQAGVYSLYVSGSSGCEGIGQVEINNDNCLALQVLPIDLTSFEGENRGAFNFLFWSTEREVASDVFKIERRFESEDKFMQVGSVKAAGYSFENVDYSFSDFDIERDGIYYYRLAEYDLNGKKQLSKVVAINVERVERDKISVFPNPAVDKFGVTLDIASSKNVELELYDVDGNLLKDAIISGELVKGVYTREVDIKKYPEGVYTLKMISDEDLITRKIIKIK